MNKRKPKGYVVDSTDREILRFMKKSNRGVSGLSIAKSVKMSATGITPRLKGLKTQGIIKPVFTSKDRVFQRTFSGSTKKKTIKSKSKTLWSIDWK